MTKVLSEKTVATFLDGRNCPKPLKIAMNLLALKPEAAKKLLMDKVEKTETTELLRSVVFNRCRVYQPFMVCLVLEMVKLGPGKGYFVAFYRHPLLAAWALFIIDMRKTTLHLHTFLCHCMDLAVKLTGWSDKISKIPTLYKHLETDRLSDLT